MEKIAIGVPYEISIEPSVDIGEFNSEMVVVEKTFTVGVALKPIKGFKNKYTFIIPSALEKILDKNSELSYQLFIYKENARFEVDKGKLMFISDEDFTVGKFIKQKMVKSTPVAANKDDKKSTTSKSDNVDAVTVTVVPKKPTVTEPIKDSTTSKSDNVSTTPNVPKKQNVKESETIKTDFKNAVLELNKKNQESISMIESLKEKNKKVEDKKNINLKIQNAIRDLKNPEQIN